MRRSAPAALIMCLAAVVSACGGSASTATVDGSASGSTDTNAEPAAQGAEAPAANGAVVAVTIADALYSTGSAHVEVSGGKQFTLDGQLAPGASMTTEGTTLLLYSAGEGENASVFSISNGADTGLAFTISAPGIITAGDGPTGCAIELTKNDGSGLEGRFTCRGLQTVGLDQAVVDVSATFSAAR